MFEDLSPLGRTELLVLASVFVGAQMLAILSVASILKHRRGNPISALSWSLSALLVPGIGPLCWWAFGRNRLKRKLRRAARGSRARNATTRTRSLPSPDRVPDSLARLIPRSALGSYAFCALHAKVDLHAEGQSAFAAIVSTIEGAKERVHVFSYIFQRDETGQKVLSALCKKAREGLSVRLLVDGFGSEKTARWLKKSLGEAGGHFEVFLPRRFNPLSIPRLNFINHRKMIICDDEIAFVGGMNIGVDYEKTWRDAIVQIEGPGARAAQEIFLEDWFHATGEDLKSAPPSTEVMDACPCAFVASGPDTENWIERVFVAAILEAKERLYITTPYLIPTSTVKEALAIAAGRGVDVRLIVPKTSDVSLVTWASRAFYDDFLKAGVKIWEFETTMLHAKTMVSDQLSLVGSANLDRRSLMINFEICSVFSDSALAEDLVKMFRGLEAQSSPVEMARERQKGGLSRSLEGLAHLLSPLL